MDGHQPGKRFRRGCWEEARTRRPHAGARSGCGFGCHGSHPRDACRASPPCRPRPAAVRFAWR
uniref:Uncharacterized protein n=1 Tax=Leersia perrieri TaxID=77586 RepID=A0A0D9V5N4_9ORYZ